MPCGDDKIDVAPSVESVSEDAEKCTTHGSETEKCAEYNQNRANNGEARNVTIPVHRTMKKAEYTWTDERVIKIDNRDHCRSDHETNASEECTAVPSNAKYYGCEEQCQGQDGQ